MDFSTAIESKMKDVNDGPTESFMIYRDNNGGWHCDYTQNQHGETFDWVMDARTQDPLALTFCGKDFASGSFPYVYDVVLSYAKTIQTQIPSTRGRNYENQYCVHMWTELRGKQWVMNNCQTEHFITTCGK